MYYHLTHYAAGCCLLGLLLSIEVSIFTFFQLSTITFTSVFMYTVLFFFFFSFFEEIFESLVFIGCILVLLLFPYY